MPTITPIDSYMIAAQAAATAYALATNINIAEDAYTAGYKAATLAAAEAAAIIYTDSANAFINNLVAYIQEISKTAAVMPTSISATIYDSIMTKFDKSYADYIISLTP
jgi:hypothetical protein